LLPEKKHFDWMYHFRVDAYQHRKSTLFNEQQGTEVRPEGPFHPQTQGKIARWHQTLKNRILLENNFLPSDLECQIDAFVEHYKHQHYQERLKNVTPADAYFGRAEAIIQQRERIKRKTIENRRLKYQKFAA
jgi:putative transposase